jgi:hypothetical protein
MSYLNSVQVKFVINKRLIKMDGNLDNCFYCIKN